MINYIHTQPNWMNGVAEKAKANGCTDQQQIYRDAIWQIDNNRKLEIVNNRWKRNPRTGKYKIMLVVTTESGMNNLPASIKNISVRETGDDL